MELTSEYKYGYLLSKCKCGEMFHPNEINVLHSMCIACRFPVSICDCGVEFPAFDGDRCHECENRHNEQCPIVRCSLCGSLFSVIDPCDEECSICEYLEKRGKFTNSHIILKGFPDGKENGICIGCDNKLYHTSGPNCVCRGCHIEPFHGMMIKTASRK